MEYRKQLERYRRRREKILALLASGLGRTQVAIKLGVSRQRIHQIVQEARAR
jgi:hypothetical protein